MKYSYVTLLFSIVLVGFISLSSDDANSKVPIPKIKEFTNNYIIISNDTRLVRKERLYNKYKASFDSLRKTLRRNGDKDAPKLEFVFSGIQDPTPLNEKQRAYLDIPEAYLLIIGQKRINIMSRYDQGLLNGLSTLEALINQYEGKLPQGWIVDYPDMKMRVLHLSLWPCTIKDFKEHIRLARFSHYNALILYNHYGVDLRSLQHLNIKGKAKWSIKEFKEIVTLSKENGMEVIPQLSLLSHQKTFMKDFHPQYMYNKATYDPRKKELYEKIVFPAIDELLTLTGATKFHIGHDEVAGWKDVHYKKKY